MACISVYPQDDEDPEKLMDFVDTTMRWTKNRVGEYGLFYF